MNGAEEDACVFARSHPARASETALLPAVPSPGGRPRGPQALFNLAQRDEGVLTRLKFLLNAAHELGFLTGLSLFDLNGSRGTPFVPGSNVQGLVWPAPARASEPALFPEALQEVLLHAAEWIALEARGRPRVWIDVCRGAGDRAHMQPLLAPSASASTNVSRGSAKYPGRRRKARGWRSPESMAARRCSTPRRSASGTEPGTTRLPWAAQTCFAGAGETRLPHVLLLDTPPNPRRPGLRDSLWRLALRGCWAVSPLPPAAPGEALAPLAGLGEMARVSEFWLPRQYLRPAPECLAAPQTDGLTAACNGRGRWFFYSGGKLPKGAAIALPPGSYRYFWIDPASNDRLDRGDGIPGGRSVSVPAPPGARRALLIVEQDDSPDPLAAW